MSNLKDMFGETVRQPEMDGENQKREVEYIW